MYSNTDGCEDQKGMGFWTKILWEGWSVSSLICFFNTINSPNTMFLNNPDSFHSECKEESTVNNMLKTKKIKNMKSFEDCRNKCQQNVKCDFFNFKVKSFEFGILFQLIHFQHHQNLKKRRCFLLEIFTEKIGWVSGDKLCSSSKSTTASTALMNTTTINTNGGTLNSYLNLNQINYMYI